MNIRIINIKISFRSNQYRSQETDGPGCRVLLTMRITTVGRGALVSPKQYGRSNNTFYYLCIYMGAL